MRLCTAVRRPACGYRPAVSSGSRRGCSVNYERLSLIPASAQYYRLPPSVDSTRALLATKRRTVIYRMPHRYKPILHVYGVSGIVASRALLLGPLHIANMPHLVYANSTGRSERRCDVGTESTEVDRVHNYLVIRFHIIPKFIWQPTSGNAIMDWLPV